MKNYTQVYVKDSIEAARTYCDAFGAEITFAIKNECGTAYEHCELSVDGEGFLAIAEAKEPPVTWRWFHRPEVADDDLQRV